MYRKVIIILVSLGAIAGMFALGNFILSMGEKPDADSADLYAFTLKDLNDKEHNLADYKGKFVFLNFWATWCPPCRAEMPSMQKMYETWDQSKYVLIAVNSGETKKHVKKFAEENGYTFPILLDKDSKIARQFNIRGIPTTFIIGKDGQVLEKIVGSREWTAKDMEFLTE